MRAVIEQERVIPAAIRALSPMDADYIDLFVASHGADGATPERWARAAMEEGPGLGRFLAWQVACGLRLDTTPSPGRVAGWAVGERRDDLIRMEASSWYLTAHVAFLTQGSTVSMATFVRYDRPLARALWGAISVVHRAAVPGFLGAAAGRIARDGP